MNFVEYYIAIFLCIVQCPILLVECYQCTDLVHPFICVSIKLQTWTCSVLTGLRVSNEISNSSASSLFFPASCQLATCFADMTDSLLTHHQDCGEVASLTLSLHAMLTCKRLESLHPCCWGCRLDNSPVRWQTHGLVSQTCRRLCR